MLAYCLCNFFIVYFSPTKLLSSCFLVSRSEAGFWATACGLSCVLGMIAAGQSFDMCVVVACVCAAWSLLQQQKTQKIANRGFSERAGHVMVFFLTSLCCQIWQFHLWVGPFVVGFLFFFFRRQWYVQLLYEDRGLSLSGFHRGDRCALSRLSSRLRDNILF